MEEHIQLKKELGDLSDQRLGSHDVRDAIVDYVAYWSEHTEIPARRFVAWLGVAQSKFYDWRLRYGLANEHNALIPRDWWLEELGEKGHP